MIEEAKADLEDHLKSIDEKLESTFSRAADESSGDATEMRQMQEERSSTQQGLEICAQLSSHIARIQPLFAADHGHNSTDARAMPPPVAKRITREGLEECQDTIGNMANRLEEHRKSIMDRLMAKSKTALSSPQDAADLERLQEEWETAKLGLDICSKANESMTKVAINVFENIKGDKEVLQFFASTTGKIVHAKDISLGARGGAVWGPTQRCFDPTNFTRLLPHWEDRASGSDAGDGHPGGYGRNLNLRPSLRVGF